MKSYKDKVNLIKEEYFSNLPPAPQNILKTTIIASPTLAQARNKRSNLSLALVNLVVILFIGIMITGVILIGLQKGLHKNLPNDSTTNVAEPLIIQYAIIANLRHANDNLFTSDEFEVSDQKIRILNYYVSIFDLLLATEVNLTEESNIFTFTSPSLDEDYNFRVEGDYNLQDDLALIANYQGKTYNIYRAKSSFVGKETLKLSIFYNDENYIIVEQILNDSNYFILKIIKDNLVFSEVTIYLSNDHNLYLIDSLNTKSIYKIRKMDKQYNINYFPVGNELGEDADVIYNSAQSGIFEALKPENSSITSNYYISIQIKANYYVYQSFINNIKIKEESIPKK